MKNHDLSSQDVRAKILKLRDSIILNLEFLQKAIDRDLEFLQKYYDRFGDLNYRPVIGRDIDGGANYGERTETMLEPVASKYRATIKSLLDSVRLIEAEILPEDNPEGSQASSAPDEATAQSKRTSLRASFTADAQHSGRALEPIDDEDSDEAEGNAVQVTTPATKLAETPKPTSKAPSKSTIATIPTAEPKAKPWRTKAPVLVKQENVEAEPKKSDEPKPIETKSLMNPATLDPDTERLRAQFQSLRPGNKMAGLMSRYGKGKVETED